MATINRNILDDFNSDENVSLLFLSSHSQGKESSLDMNMELQPTYLKALIDNQPIRTVEDGQIVQQCYQILRIFENMVHLKDTLSDNFKKQTFLYIMVKNRNEMINRANADDQHYDDILQCRQFFQVLLNKVQEQYANLSLVTTFLYKCNFNLNNQTSLLIQLWIYLNKHIRRFKEKVSILTMISTLLLYGLELEQMKPSIKVDLYESMSHFASNLLAELNRISETMDADSMDSTSCFIHFEVCFNNLKTKVIRRENKMLRKALLSYQNTKARSIFLNTTRPLTISTTNIIPSNKITDRLPQLLSAFDDVKNLQNEVKVANKFIKSCDNSSLTSHTVNKKKKLHSYPESNTQLQLHRDASDRTIGSRSTSASSTFSSFSASTHTTEMLDNSSLFKDFTSFL
ncbi:hypothetical protein NCAS_0A11290 [Naumovozyma castellii]|uniref:Uncharacterized protein n=1 Tax=Naumovozyma castellii TaxID=27288 RepID=G0V889_NAUCA|nr:hypothetical protein NCAS_0A11290 [Naumovozyma castellii CBS 4309]CCC67687.1 hypothetical protein NCAS_0A11290 [Naumovozyma castellii CBS 4309]